MTDELRVLRSDSQRPAPAGRGVPQSLAVARWCAGRGWPVHPLAPGRKTSAGNCADCREPGHTHQGCGCPAAGRWCHGFRAATLDFARIEQWWGAHPEFAVGVACGAAELVVIDIDAHARQLPARNRLLPGIGIADTVDLTGLAHGFHTLGVLAALRGAASPADDGTTLRVRTPSGGLHVWYRAAGGHRWQCSSGSGGGRALAWQVDVRAHGGYIVAPGTVTEAGEYEAVGTAREPAPLPGWLARELERTGHLPPVHVPAPRPVPPRARQAVLAASGGPGAATRALAPLLAEVAACAAVPEGAGFTEKLNRQHPLAARRGRHRAVGGGRPRRVPRHHRPAGRAQHDRTAAAPPARAEHQRDERELTQARSAPGMVLNAALLDADPCALCTPGGIVDLRTGLRRVPDPSKDFHSRSTTATPEPMPTPRWDRFLADTFGDDAEGREMVDFLHLLLGYSITGDVGAQVMPFLFGSGKNGESVLLDVVMKLVGDYADAAPPGFLMARSYEGHPTDLAELHGRRVIVCSEVKPGDRFDEARVKLLTGGDRIKARRMRQDFFSFQPTHKLWLLGNHRPEVGTGGFAFWRRMRLIPFERVVPDDRKVDNLADILVTEEGAGILNWLVEGARRYLNGERDLLGPEAVRIATTAYAETEDHTGRFLGESCQREPGLRAEQTGLYAAYRAWCQNEGAPAVSSRSFAARVREAVGLASPKEMILSNQRKYCPGIGLTADEESV